MVRQCCKVCNKLTGMCCKGSEDICNKEECCDQFICMCDGLEIGEDVSYEWPSHFFSKTLIYNLNQLIFYGNRTKVHSKWREI